MSLTLKEESNYRLVNKDYTLSKEYEIYLNRNLKKIYEYSKKLDQNQYLLHKKLY